MDYHTSELETEDLDKGLKRAIREYEQILNRDPSWRKGPFLVSDDISEAAFEQWRGGQEVHWKLVWEPSTLSEDRKPIGSWYGSRVRYQKTLTVALGLCGYRRSM